MSKKITLYRIKYACGCVHEFGLMILYPDSEPWQQKTLCGMHRPETIEMIQRWHIVGGAKEE